MDSVVPTPKQTRYSVGFAFDNNFEHVALIEKNRGGWQQGLLNGIGGHVEPGEDALACQIREFYEETGVRELEWFHFATMTFPSAHISCYTVMRPHLLDLFSKTDEQVKIILTSDLAGMCMKTQVVPNLKWLVPLSVDSLRQKKHALVSAR